MPNGPSTSRNVALSAMPVTMPGSASGRMTRNEIVSRPKNRWRETASDASVPSTSAIAVAPMPAFSDVNSASRTPGLWNALSNHSSVKPPVGQPSVRLGLNA
jgi:hypothetical protein